MSKTKTTNKEYYLICSENGQEQRIAITKEKYDSFMLDCKEVQAKSVLQGKVMTFTDLEQATMFISTVMNEKSETVYTNLQNCIGERFSRYGFYWSYTDKTKTEKHLPTKEFVRELETGKVRTTKEIDDDEELHWGNINECCNGKRKMAHGSHWEYV